MKQAANLRRFNPSDTEYEAIVQVYNQANPHEPGSAVTWKHWDQHRDPAKLFTRYVAECRGAIGAYGYSLRPDAEARKFHFGTFFCPAWENAELIHQFGSYIMEQCRAFKPVAFIARAKENQVLKIAWLESQAFEPIMRYPRSTLDVAAFDPGVYDRVRARIAEQGLEILSLAELSKRDPGWQKKVYDLEILLNKDVPRPSGFSPPPFEKYRQTEFEAPEFMPELWLVALDGDVYVGMTSLWKHGDDQTMMETGLTGIRREYRRQGVATAMKCSVIEQAQRTGVQIIQTYNEENNPMFHLNLRLGFEAQPADVDWEKKVGN